MFKSPDWNFWKKLIFQTSEAMEKYYLFLIKTLLYAYCLFTTVFIVHVCSVK